MTDNNLDIPRRKLLGAMGTIGGAAALGGASTMAFFSDDEEFANNRLVAGSLDLKLAWREHYFGAGAEASFESGAFQSAGAFLSGLESSVEEYPGDADAGVSFETLSADCAQSDLYADTPEDLDPTSTSSHRPLNDDTYDSVAQRPRPLVSIQDAKPGDFGFTRFRLLLCDNPGYLWATGGIQSTAENGTTEPEEKDQQQGAGGQFGPGELAEEIKVQVFQTPDQASVDGLLGQVSAASGPQLVESFFETFQLRDQDNPPSLADLSTALSQGNGLPLDGDPVDGQVGSFVGSDVFFYDLQSPGGLAQGERDCFDTSGGAGNLGLVWGLPVDHANEIQTDSVSVDVGFYAEQCRHNDGSGMGNSS